MSSKWGTRLAVLTAAAAVTGAGLLSAGAGAAMASGTPGTTGLGTWHFLTFHSDWVAHDGITHTTSQPTVSYSATVQQPINAPGQIPSVFSNKTRTIPVKYKVNKCTTPGASADHYPGLLQSDTTLDPNAYPGADPSWVATNVNWAPPRGSTFTVSQITSLMAHFTWAQGSDYGGSLRWQVDTPDGALYVYYGDSSSQFQSATPDANAQSGTDMRQLSDIRVEFQGVTNPIYQTWSDALGVTAPTAAYGTLGNEPVQDIGLVTDSGWSAPQAVQLQDATIVTPLGTTTYTPGDVSSGGGSTTCAPDTADNFWVSLTKISGNAPPAPVDESTITDTQGDSGGQFRQVDGMYMYNLPMSQLDPTAQYQVGISPNSNGSSPAGVVQFGLK